MNLGYALAQGLAAGAQSASGMLGDEIKREAAEAAEDRAANRKLSMEERLIGIREAAAQRAEERKMAQNRVQGAAIKTAAKGMLDGAQNAQLEKLASQDDALSPEEVAALSPEGRKRYGLPDTGELATLKREAAAAMELGDTARAKEINDRIKDLETADRGKSQDETAERRHQERMKHEKDLIALRAKADKGDPKATAEIKNIDDIANTLFGGDRAKAYEYKAAQQGKSRSQVVRDMLPLVKDDTNLDTPQKKLAYAEELADGLLAKETSTKTAVRGKASDPPKPGTSKAPLDPNYKDPAKYLQSLGF